MSGPPPASSWAAPPEFYIDENLAGKTVRRLIADLGYVVHTPSSVFGRATLGQKLADEDWLPLAGKNGWVVFGRDQRILERPRELDAFLKAKIHMFLLPGSVALAEIVQLVERNLQEICALATARRPNVYWLTKDGVEPYERRVGRRARRRTAGPTRKPQ